MGGQGNRGVPGLRWLRYKEGFPSSFVEQSLGTEQGLRVLDPFSGIGTTPVTAAWLGHTATGIEVMPVGVCLAESLRDVGRGVDVGAFAAAARDLLVDLQYLPLTSRKAPLMRSKVARGAFPDYTESGLTALREFADALPDPTVGSLIRLAAMCVLEDVSYTRKDGQFLRWDRRAPRQVRSDFQKPSILGLRQALTAQLRMMSDDVEAIGEGGWTAAPEIMAGSCLELLAGLEARSFDAVVTSPPYVNRYDYVRTYALELEWLGVDGDGMSRLRQEMLSATVENRPKDAPPTPSLAMWERAHQMVERHEALGELLSVFDARRRELNNPSIPKMIESYFVEMAYVIGELARLLSPGGRVVMVNDNVSYLGVQVPVDLVLSDMAEIWGLECESIRSLPGGKGNSSQQMKRFGRTPNRKSIMEWRQPGAVDAVSAGGGTGYSPRAERDAVA